MLPAPPSGRSLGVVGAAEIGRMREDLKPVLGAAVKPETSGAEAAGSIGRAFGILLGRPEAELRPSNAQAPAALGGIMRRAPREGTFTLPAALMPGPYGIEESGSDRHGVRLQPSAAQGRQTGSEAPKTAGPAGNPGAISEEALVGSYKASIPQFYFSYDSTFKINADHTVEFEGEPSDYDARDAGWETSNRLIAFRGKGAWEFKDGKLAVRMDGAAVGPDSQTFDDPLSASMVLDLSATTPDQLKAGAKVPVASPFFGDADWIVAMTAGAAVRPAPQPAPASTVRPEPAEPHGAWRWQKFSYGLKRRTLAAIAAVWGIQLSLPAAGEGLTSRVLAEVAKKRVLFTDYDDTLGPHNSVLAPDMVEALVRARRAGKEIAIVTDRPDVKREGSTTLTIFESLSSVPAADRAGIFVSANNGGRVYGYDARGEPVKLYEAPPLADAEVAANREANEAAKARLASIGVSLYPGDKAIGTESYGPYGYAMMLQVGTPEAKVKAAGDLLQVELDKRGIRHKVQPRLAKDPTKPPYLTYSKLDKSVPVAYVAKLLGVRAEDAAAIGDSVYNPGEKPLHGVLKWTAPAAKRFGERLGGRKMPDTGNDTDSNMERGLPGMLMLSVGGSAYATIRNSFVLPDKGPPTTRRVLEALASRPAGGASGIDGLGSALGPTAAVLGILALAAGVIALETFLFYQVLQGVFERAADFFQYRAEPFFDLGALGAGAAGLMGFAGSVRAGRAAPAGPEKAFQTAYAKALKTAADLGMNERQVWFAEATASWPSRDGRGWRFAFYLAPDPKAKTADILYVDFARRFSESLQEHEASLHRGVPTSDRVLPFPLQPYLAAMGTKVSPEGALDAARRRVPGLAAAVGVSYAMQEEPVSGDKDLWYRFYDDAGNAAAVNARTGEVREIRRAGSAKSAPGAEGGTFSEAAATGGRASPDAGPEEYGERAVLAGSALGSVALYGLAQALAAAVGIPAFAVWGGALLAAMPVSLILFLVSTGRDERGNNVVARPGLDYAAKIVMAGALGTGLIDFGASLLGRFFPAALGLGVMGLARTARRNPGGSAARGAIADEDVLAAARAMSSYKGHPWSETEYNASVYYAAESLRRRGASEAQLELFHKTCASLPVRSGGFNPWSGD